MCLAFDHVMQLLALSALFDFGAPQRFLGAPRWLRLLVVALTASRVARVLLYRECSASLPKGCSEGCPVDDASDASDASGGVGSSIRSQLTWPVP